MTKTSSNPRTISLLSPIALLCSLTACRSAAADPVVMLDSGGEVIADCALGDFVDRRGGGEVTIGFGGVQGSGPFEYSPRCVLLDAGQPVRFVGDFSTHPLSPGLVPGDLAESPIPRTSGGNEITVVFGSAGTFPYLCDFHYAAGMRGVIRAE